MNLKSYIKKNNRTLGIILLILLCTSVTTYFYSLNFRLKQENIQLKNKFEAFSILESNKDLIEMVLTHPYTSSINGLKIVSGWSINYQYDASKENPFEDNLIPPYFYTVIFCSENNVTLKITTTQKGSNLDINIPLTIQKGNAFLNESSTRIIKSDLETNDTVVGFMSPILYSRNTTAQDKINVQILNKGWYTISMTGPIWISPKGAISYSIGIPSLDDQNHDVVNQFAINCDISIEKKGKNRAFIVWEKG